MKPYAIISDIHAHAWSAFSRVNDFGVNTRLQAILNEIGNACDTVIKAGGWDVVVSGDLFHVRGNIAPSVLIPVMDLFRRMTTVGICFHIIPGNHDLEGRDSKRVSSAVAALESISGVKVYHEPGTILLSCGQYVRLVPWFDRVDDLKSELEGYCQDAGHAGEKWDDVDLILHAPINGTIMGIPDHGLEPAELQALGFKRVFAGHYHNHKWFDPHAVYSVGAIGHHSWSDAGSKAGFLLVHPNHVEFTPSSLPSFVDVSEHTPLDDIPKLVNGNYARVRVETTKASDIEKMREYLEKKCGALGTVVISMKKPTIERTGAVQIDAGSTLEASVSSFIGGMGHPLATEVQQRALQVLAEAEVLS